MQVRGKATVDGYFSVPRGSFGAPDIPTADEVVRVTVFPTTSINMQSEKPGDLISPDLLDRFVSTTLCLAPTKPSGRVSRMLAGHFCVILQRQRDLLWVYSRALKSTRTYVRICSGVSVIKSTGKYPPPPANITVHCNVLPIDDGRWQVSKRTVYGAAELRLKPCERTRHTGALQRRLRIR